MNCPKCNSFNDVGCKFCANCGSSLVNTNNISDQDISTQNTLTEKSVVTSSVQQIPSVNIASQNVQLQVNSNLHQNMVTNNTITQNDQLVGTSNIPDSSNNKKVNVKLLAIIGAVIVAIVIGIFVIPKLFNRGEEGESLKESLTKSDSFWLLNNEGYYALFDIDGNQLTEFDFSSVSSQFVNGTARVKNKNDEYGLISSDGKMVIEFGKFKYIFENYAVYEMVDMEYNDYLYDSSGKLVRPLDDEIDEEIESFIGEYTYALIESDLGYKVIDYNGKEIVGFPIPEEDDDVRSPSANSVGNYVSVFYNGTSYIIDVSKGKVLLTVSDPRHFCIGDINENNSNEFILRSCNSWYGDDYDYGFKLIRDGKIIYSKESKDYSSMSFKGNNVVYDTDRVYLLDESGNEKTDVSSYIIYKDYNNYIKEADGIFNGGELYVNGEFKEAIDCNDIQGGYAIHSVYLLNNCNGYGNGNKIYINADGSRINDKSYKRAYDFDVNGYAPVSEDAENYYLINLKGEKVSDYYANNGSSDKIYNISGTDNLYYGSNKDGTRTIFEVNGDKLLTGDISIPFTKIHAKGEYVVVEKDGKFTLHDLLARKDIITLNSEPDLNSYYFTTSENSKTQYYSYTTGKLFLEK